MSIPMVAGIVTHTGAVSTHLTFNATVAGTVTHTDVVSTNLGFKATVAVAVRVVRCQ